MERPQKLGTRATQHISYEDEAGAEHRKQLREHPTKAIDEFNITYISSNNSTMPIEISDHLRTWVQKNG